MDHLVSIWGNAMSIVDNKPESYAKNITLRYAITVPFDGYHPQITLDNFTGTEAVSFERVTIAKGLNNNDCEADSFVDVLFKGQPKLTLQAGENCKSDPASICFKKGELLTVSIYLKDFTLMRCGVLTQGPLSKAIYAVGDQSHTAKIDHTILKQITWFYFLSQVDLMADEKCTACICYGDSITAQDWPEYLQLKLMENDKNVAIVRRAVSGARVLRQYDCLMYESYGLKGTTRFPHEKIACGANKMIILQGVNDIIHPVGLDINEFRPMTDLPTAQELADGLMWYADEAKACGYQVYMATALPIKHWRTYNESKNALREEVNELIRTMKVDGVVDFDAVMCDETDPPLMKKELNSGDGLHPSKLGYQTMADYVYNLIFK